MAQVALASFKAWSRSPVGLVAIGFLFTRLRLARARRRFAAALCLLGDFA